MYTTNEFAVNRDTDANTYHTPSENAYLAFAQEWADGFVCAPEVHTRDALLFAQVDFDFARLCRVKRDPTRFDRLTEDRIHRFLTVEEFGEDFRRLIRIARGIRITVPLS